MKFQIAEALSVAADLLQFTPVSGGSINQGYRIRSQGASWFGKINSAERFPSMFEKEAAGLSSLRAAKAIRVPAVIEVLNVGFEQCLLMEWIEPGNTDDLFWKRFGEQLAQLHSIQHDQFGFSHDNYMGSLVQPNEYATTWAEFFTQRRLRVQADLAAERGKLGKSDLAALERLYVRLPSIFPEEHPVLLHGDLWSGNFLCAADGQPVLIDPAVYFGSRHVDLAMTTLFGGFEKVFYEAYDYHYPLTYDHKILWEICNLYPLLVHLNLFGTAYLSPIRNTLRHF